MANARDALWAAGHDESVEVNQRALIDKVLARYSGEFTVFRELLQNSDDARARSVEIHFETKAHLERKARSKTSTSAESDGQESEAPALEPAAPASSDTVVQRLPNLKTELVHQWTFKNNGIVFRDEDWSRLKKIAEGNPDEEKIGAFGVGFYSLFSVTEEPFVTSGNQWMGFYWKNKGDQLFARRGDLPPSSDASPGEREWTSFEMQLREPAPIPSAFDFTRFLASSITFMTSLAEVSVFFDDKRLARLTKDPGVPRQLSLPPTLKASSDMNMMHVRGIETTPLHITAEVMRWVHTVGSEKPPPPPKQQQQHNAKANLAPAAASGRGGFFSSLLSSFTTPTPSRSTTPLPPIAPVPAAPKVKEVDPLELLKSSVVLSIYAADVEVRLSQKMITELVRSTKKNPPQRLKYQLIYTGKDEYDASRKEDEQQPKATGSVFQGLRADLEGTGAARIFIGHATAQTTGLGGHMAARFIPTVERESIDLVDRNVAIWNRELLYVGGYLARAAYNLEMGSISDLWTGAAASTAGTVDPELQTWLRARSLHALQFFTFHRSTPSQDVSAAFETAFFTCGAPGKNAFPLMSTMGVRNALDIRLPDKSFTTFLKHLPVLPDGWEDEGMIASLLAQRLLPSISDQDVLRELREHPLSETEMVACFKWWSGEAKAGPKNPKVVRFRDQLLDAAILTLGAPNGGDYRIVPLSTVKTFINQKKIGGLIPTDGPLPEHVLPIAVSRHFGAEALTDAFGWSELSLADWLRHITKPDVAAANVAHDITQSAPAAERLLVILARAWPSTSNEQKAEIMSLLQPLACIPTSAGLRKPADCYMPSVNLLNFTDLPLITLPSGNSVKKDMERVLLDLNIPRHVELQRVFNIMVRTGDWSIAELTKYLVSIQSTMSEDEWTKLRGTAAFPKEGEVGPDGRRLFKASELYEPSDSHRDLGLAVLDWGQKSRWRPNSEDAKLLYKLGLRRLPPLNELINRAADPKPEVREKAFKYLLDNVVVKYPAYDPNDFGTVAFIPTSDGKLATTREVFSEAEWSSLGFAVVDPKLRQEVLTKLRIRQHPPTSMLVNLIQKTPPKDPNVATQWFSVLAGHVADFSTSELTRLGQMSIVPVQSGIGEKAIVRMLCPRDCHFASQTRAQFHSKLFFFVDFGQRANSFLSACGTKHAPTVEEMAQIMLNDPQRFYQLADGKDNYLDELRNFAVNIKALSSTTLIRMKRSNILLGLRRVRKEKPGEKTILTSDPSELDEEDWDVENKLLRPEHIIIVDDTNAYQIFGDAIYTAPQEDILEGFYAALGSERLSHKVREEYKTTAEIKGSKTATDVRALVLERLPLFLHEHTHSRPRRPYDWLAEGDHFVVRSFGKINVSKTLVMPTGSTSRSQEASAVAKQAGASQIQLWLAGHSQVDLYEVATSLNRLLFDSPRSSDGLLFMTILSTDLRSLQRRGYNVSRILRQQKAKREAAEEAQRQLEKQYTAENEHILPIPEVSNPASRPISSQAGRAEPPVPFTHTTEAVSEEDSPLLGGPTGPPGAEHSDDSKRHSKRPHSIVNSIQKWGRKFADGGGPPKGPTGSISDSRPGHRPYDGGSEITPHNNIAANVRAAVQACRQESGDVLHNREQMQMVQESLEEGYCDVSGRTDDLRHIADVQGYRIYVSKEVTNPTALMAEKSAALERFLPIVSQLREIYQLPHKSLHIFYDAEGGLIAFNRNSSIFLNLRYYIGWHDDEVKRGDITKAYISWYFSLGHEIAHNLVQPHNSEHEFYFSAICEQHMLPLSHLLSSLSSPGVSRSRT